MTSPTTADRQEMPLESEPGNGGSSGPSIWARLGGFSFRHRRGVLLSWIGLLVLVFGAVATVGTSSDSSFESPDSESARGFEVLTEHFASAGSFISGSIVYEATGGVDDPDVQAAMTDLFDEIDAIDGVTVTSPYTELGAQSGLVSQDGTIARATIDFAENVSETESAEIGVEVNELVADIDVDGLTIEVGGAALAEFEPPEAELIGLAFAVVILILSFGSVLAMGLPIGVALFGVGIGVGTIQLLTNVLSIPDFATTLGAMIGLGVGIDYALFIVTRYREGTRAGLDPERATVTAIDTAGRAVVFAGSAVVISLLGMYVIGLAFINGLATGAAVTVAITMVASITLLPALIGFAQERVEITRYRGLIMAGGAAIGLLGVGIGFPILGLIGLVVLVGTLILSLFVPKLREALPPRAHRDLRDTWSYRWSRFVQRRPWPVAISVTLFLLLLASPVLGLRLGFGDESTYAENTTTRQAYELSAEGFGAGSNGPLLLVSEIDDPAQFESAAALVETLNGTEGVVRALGPIPSDDQAAIQIIVIPTTGPQEEATSDLVQNLREDVIPAATDGTGLDVSVTGSVASSVDFSSYLGERIPFFFAAVLTLSFLLLMMVFRSILVPLKAVIMNLLSIGGAYGLVVVVFQWGWGIDIFGTGSGPIEPFLPMMLFAIVFGLSMDYEVFLLSRVKEEYDRTGDAVTSVADGLAATARVITAAAAIMVVVFGSFVLEDNRIIKMFGLGLASAVFLDATLVRMLLVPATMELLGEKNWWLPKWLDRILPSLNVEGPGDDHASDVDERVLVDQGS
ncbi:MMPL family transporter [Ilumatobacter sp.]|uniref:MMPL family transporter n=1 Tax=Ilumatobacter sp. TaxID=1967498 RepID=UPI003C420199